MKLISTLFVVSMGLTSIAAQAQVQAQAQPLVQAHVARCGAMSGRGSGPSGSYTAEDVLQAQTEAQNENFWASLLRSGELRQNIGS
jgi:hypothetical protein